jgi:pantothenate synthetase
MVQQFVCRSIVPGNPARRRRLALSSRNGYLMKAHEKRNYQLTNLLVTVYYPVKHPNLN